VNQDRSVTPIDVLLVINTLNAGGSRTLSAAEGEATAMVDVNADSQVTPLDCLSVVKELNQESVAKATAGQASSDDTSVDDLSVDDGTVNDKAVDDGTVEAVSTDDGTTDDGTTDDGTIDDGTTNDGTTDDGTTGHHGCGHSPPPSIDDLFSHADANDDGVLTEDELPEQRWYRLSSADADGDGSITPTELAGASSDFTTHDRGPRSHRGHGPGSGMPLDGTARRV
jgi:hypothetical protein